ncbi:MAG: hypothetical protein RR415_09950 [Ruthenibacterium sp.]
MHETPEYDLLFWLFINSPGVLLILASIFGTIFDIVTASLKRRLDGMMLRQAAFYINMIWGILFYYYSPLRETTSWNVFIIACTALAISCIIRLKLKFPKGATYYMKEFIKNAARITDTIGNMVSDITKKINMPDWCKSIVNFTILTAIFLLILFYGNIATTALCIVLLFVLSAINLHSALHSCSGLLAYWFCDCLAIAVFLVAQGLKVTWIDVSLHKYAYIVFILFYALLWITSTLIADDDPAKLASSIINTMVAIITVIANILLEIYSENIAALFASEGHMNGVEVLLPTAINMMLLPILAAGLLASLAKEVQIYCRKP